MSIISKVLVFISEEKSEKIVDGKRELVDVKTEKGILADKPEYTRDEDGSIERMTLKERTDRSRAQKLASAKTSTKVHRKRSMERRKNLIDA